MADVILKVNYKDQDLNRCIEHQTEMRVGSRRPEVVMLVKLDGIRWALGVESPLVRKELRKNKALN